MIEAVQIKDLFPNIIRSKKQKDDFTAEVHRMEYAFAKIREKLRNSIGRVSSLTLWKNEAQTYPNTGVCPDFYVSRNWLDFYVWDKTGFMVT